MSIEPGPEFDSLLDKVPDPGTARVFLARLQSNHPQTWKRLLARENLLISLSTLASYSPYLSEILLTDPGSIDWLQKELDQYTDTVKPKERYSEDLARFSLKTGTENLGSILLHFKQREFLRIYLRDCLGIGSLSEITEELSNLADAILECALSHVYSKNAQMCGPPLTRDERGRVAQAAFAIVSLGKLGCRELNYSSDIDLFFLYIGDGETSGETLESMEGNSLEGPRSRKTVSNKHFFTEVAKGVVNLIRGTGPGMKTQPVYRVDLRIRPFGRVGDLVWEISRAAEYYGNEASTWEKQALIRTRKSAGSDEVVNRFLEMVEGIVFQRGGGKETISDVNRVRLSIDREVARVGGAYNVKLGRGGIREIEFITQVLQLVHGSQEKWLRAANMLIVLGRLAEKGLLSEVERSKLSSAYTFFRTVEHRLQMEHGAQTHNLPTSQERLRILARRCGFLEQESPIEGFLREVEMHSSSVRSIYERVVATELTGAEKPSDQRPDSEVEDVKKRDSHLLHASSELMAVISTVSSNLSFTSDLVEQLADYVSEMAGQTISPIRSTRNAVKYIQSLTSYIGSEHQESLTPDDVAGEGSLHDALHAACVLGVSDHLSQLIINRPKLLFDHRDTGGENRLVTRETCLEYLLRISRDSQLDTDKRDALRRGWQEIILKIGHDDIAWASGIDSGDEIKEPLIDQFLDDSSQPQMVHLRDVNLRQTSLAEATLEAGTLTAIEEMGMDRSAIFEFKFSILGLGRLGHTGMDYGSDLDLLFVYDDEIPWNTIVTKDASFDRREAFFTTLVRKLIQVLSSVSREGFLYRVDLRLRPDGTSGPLAIGLHSLMDYLAKRASSWEHSAYLKAREVVGDMEFGRHARENVTSIIFETSRRNEKLAEELSSVRYKLEEEKVRSTHRNIKWGAGGMTDVYFITRFLQLENQIAYPTEKGTLALVSHLGSLGKLDLGDAKKLHKGYCFLRRIDHWNRLLFDRPQPVVPLSTRNLQDIVSVLGLESVKEFSQQYEHHTSNIRDIFKRIMADT